MKFGLIIDLIEDPAFSRSTSLVNKSMFVFDHKNRKLTDLKFYDGYSITKKAKEDLKNFCQNENSKDVTYFIVTIFLDSICIYDENHGFKLKLDRAS